MPMTQTQGQAYLENLRGREGNLLTKELGGRHNYQELWSRARVSQEHTAGRYLISGNPKPRGRQWQEEKDQLNPERGSV